MLNPFVEILARALYNKDTTPIYVTNNEWDTAKIACQFINCRTYAGRFELKGSYITMEVL